ncbi:cobalamin biosynthesis protein CbiD [Synechococcus sp. PCC 7335]|uniref:cobalt-precorrin-5B (C(1))-methyltransferase CbiD n=1 Tax=Synechococcus sp. (strain ATCC 29403 / PCC 7335) TaxID=91464 RepID=UPI00017ED1CF|nr:cobalt-precorrin-5B (C(1))-methyltransferase CbiD [Synechococcus sp. PCC 7335]EDX86021.1 cobalamin biosynthesis protein CbiD [Synechococcus sp. PCC 7335]
MTTKSTQARSGYTLPVFACAGAIASLHQLIYASALPTASFNLLNPNETVEIPIEQSALLSKTAALAITRSDPGDNLDLTRHTPVWSVVSWAERDQTEQILLEGGEGIGYHAQGDAIYAYARKLIHTHLSAKLKSTQKIRVTIILPEGRRLALRTSNAAFGVVDGLSLLGTGGIAQPLSAPEQLTAYRKRLRQKAAVYQDLVFCLGENGLDLALRHGVDAQRRLKTANWLGPLLVEAGELGVRSILLFGYHGKLIKLAGGIFHTHHHIADARQEIMAACCIQARLNTSVIQQVLASSTVEAALQILRELDHVDKENRVEKVYEQMAERIDTRSTAYIQTHTERTVQVGSILFDRQRQIIVKSKIAQFLLAN